MGVGPIRTFSEGSSSPPTMGRAGVRSTSGSTPDTSCPRSPSIPGSASRLYVGGGTSVLRGNFLESSDGGGTWTHAEKGLSGYYARTVAAYPSLPDTAYGFAFTNFFGTSDAGSSWSLVSSPQFLGSVAGLRSDGLVDSVRSIQRIHRPRRHSSGGVYKSVDGGASWADASAGLTNSTAGALAIVCFRSRDAAFEQLRRRLQDVRRGRHLGERSDRTGTGGGRGSGGSVDPVRQPALFGGTEHLPGRSTDGGGTCAAARRASINTSLPSTSPSCPRTRTSSTPS